MYTDQDLYKFLERIAVALERLANSPVTGNAPVKNHPVGPLPAAKPAVKPEAPAPASPKPTTDKLQ